MRRRTRPLLSQSQFLFKATYIFKLIKAWYFWCIFVCFAYGLVGVATLNSYQRLLHKIRKFDIPNCDSQTKSDSSMTGPGARERNQAKFHFKEISEGNQRIWWEKQLSSGMVISFECMSTLSSNCICLHTMHRYKCRCKYKHKYKYNHNYKYKQIYNYLYKFI